MEDPSPVGEGDRWVPFLLDAVTRPRADSRIPDHQRVGRDPIDCSRQAYSSRPGGRPCAVALVVVTPQHLRSPAPCPAQASPAYSRRPALTRIPRFEGCARCHQGACNQWKRSLHIRMTKPIAEAIVVGDFTGARNFARSWTRLSSSAAPTDAVHQGRVRARPPETFPVDYTLGAKRYQGYLSTLPDGRMYVLPAFWHIESRRWIDWKEITPIPDGAHDCGRSGTRNCFNCHATNLSQGFDSATRRYNTTWTEMGIGCEACHGPGASARR